MPHFLPDTDVLIVAEYWQTEADAEAVIRRAIEAADKLSRHKVMASGGHFYAYRLLEALGLNPGHGVLRVSFTHYTSPAEVQRLIEALDAELK